MKRSCIDIPSGGTIGPPPTFDAGSSADRVPVVHTVSGSALRIEIASADKDGGARDRDQLDRLGDAFQFAGVSQILPTLVGHSHPENGGKPGGTST